MFFIHVRKYYFALLLVVVYISFFTTARSQALPPWKASYALNESGALYFCNYSGSLDAKLASHFSLIDFDWSHGKEVWAQGHPMSADKFILAEAGRIKKINPNAKVFIYANMVKALPWFSFARQAIQEYANAWFLPFEPNTLTHSPRCDDNYPKVHNVTRCSTLYHDQQQTPQFEPSKKENMTYQCNANPPDRAPNPVNNGSCMDAPCDCGVGVPCGEYLWDHRNVSMQRYLVEEVVLGPHGLQHPDVDGFFFDDQWYDVSKPVQDWQPSWGFCDHNSIGGPTEVDSGCIYDMGLTQTETSVLAASWQSLMSNLTQQLLAHGGFSWQLLNGVPSVNITDEASCNAYFRSDQTKQWKNTPLFYEWTYAPDMKGVPVTPHADIVTFHLIRGPFAWIGFGWLGCVPCAINGSEYHVPEEFNNDYGAPLDVSYYEVGNGNFVRNYTSARFSVNCSSGQAFIQKN